MKEVLRIFLQGYEDFLSDCPS